MPIQAGKYDVGSISRTDEGVSVTLRDPISNQDAWPKSPNDQAYRRQAEISAKHFLDDCQRSLEKHRDKWDDILRTVEDPRAAGLWRSEYSFMGTDPKLVIGTCGTDQYVLIVHGGRVDQVVYEGWPHRNLPALRAIQIDSKESTHRYHR